MSGTEKSAQTNEAGGPEFLDEIARQSLLYDFYGELLTKRQREVMELYHGENLSLAEIAAEFGISRQGVHDALRSARKALDGYEEKLGLVQRFLKTEDAIRRVDSEILAVIGQLQRDGIESVAGAGAQASAESSTGVGVIAEPLTGADAAPHTLGGTGDLIRRLNRIRAIIDQLEE